MDFTVIITFLNSLAPWINWIWVVLGSLVVIGTVVDQLLVNVSFMEKILNIPILGAFLSFCTRFSPLNIKPKE